MDNISGKKTEHGAYDYAYDDLNHLTDVEAPTESPVADKTFTYDEEGTRHTSLDTSDDWGYNPNNELLGYDDVEYEYDANGNMTQKTVGAQVTSYVYNIEDRLIEVWDGEAGTGSVTASYYYDPFGRRLWKEVSGVRTYFHYSDEGLIGEYDSTGAEIKTYGYKPGSTWTTDPLFVKESGQYYFYHNDHLGTPQKITAVNGAVVWSAQYTSFGSAFVDPSSTITNNLRYPGQVFDEETGLHYNCQRFYDPSTGRYLRTDPIGFLGGDANLYAYVWNNPANWIDPFGLWQFSFGIGLGVAGQITFGHNGGDWNFGGGLGAGVGVGFGLERGDIGDPNGPLGGLNSSGSSSGFGIEGSGAAGLKGIADVSGGFYLKAKGDDLNTSVAGSLSVAGDILGYERGVGIEGGVNTRLRDAKNTTFLNASRAEKINQGFFGFFGFVGGHTFHNEDNCP